MFQSHSSRWRLKIPRLPEWSSFPIPLFHSHFYLSSSQNMSPHGNECHRLPLAPSKKCFLSSHFNLLPFNFRQHSPLFESEVAPNDQSQYRNRMDKATQTLASESDQPIWGPITLVLHLKTDDQCTGWGKILQISQPGAIVHPPALKPGSSSTLDNQMDWDGHLWWLSQKVFLMS